MWQSITSNKTFITGLLLSILTGLILISCSLWMGKNNLFLALNTDLGKWGDIFFSNWTNLGDGVVWVIIAIIFFIYQKNRFPLLIAAIIISTLITQLTKNYIFPAEPRPTAAIMNMSLIHTVKGVALHTAYSFPSGHTATAFTIFLLGCLLIRKNWVIPVGLVYALLVGYSRIYLAQHFPLDVGAGMITGVITVLLSVMIQERWVQRNR